VLQFASRLTHGWARTRTRICSDNALWPDRPARALDYQPPNFIAVQYQRLANFRGINARRKPALKPA
jgi:hypothetical protein